MTIKDIARLSGCSVSTISRVINNRPDVNPDTKAHVLRIMQEVGFVPNTNAQQLKIQQSRSVVFVVKSTYNPFLDDLLVHFQAQVARYDYNGVVYYLHQTDDEIEAVQRIVREIKPKGIIFLGGKVENFRARFAQVSLPCVLATVTEPDLQCGNLSLVGVDDKQAACRAVACLIEAGHQKIAVLGGPIEGHPSRQRLAGAQLAMQQAGIPWRPALYGVCGFDPASARDAVAALLAGSEPFTAVFCMSDMVAIGAVRALADAGLRVPQDVSVVGFDGLTLTRFTVPTLTTVAQPVAQIAEQGARLLLDQIERGAKGSTVILEAQILKGESVAAPAQPK